MCVALAAYHSWQEVLEYYDLQPGMQSVKSNPDRDLKAKPSAVIRPNAVHPFMRQTTDGRFLDLAIWGFPSSKGRITPVTVARCETLDVLPMFRDAFQTRRCVVPVSGYFEWKREVEGTRAPWKFSRQNGVSVPDFIALAGLYMLNQTTKQSHFVVVTTEPNEVTAEIYGRMPVILKEEGIQTWLSPDSDPADLRNICKPYDGNDLVIEPVSKTLFDRPKAIDKNQLSLAI